MRYKSIIIFRSVFQLGYINYHLGLKNVTKGKTFTEERLYGKGTPGTDLEFTDEELEEKFRHNASRILTQNKIEGAVKSIWEVETVENISELVDQVTL